MTQEQLKHKNEYEIEKRKYENAYSEKVSYSRKLASLQAEKQKVLGQINSKKADSKQVSIAQEKLSATNNKDSEINSSLTLASKNLSDAASQFKNIGTSSLGDQKDLEVVFENKNKSSSNNINSAMSEIAKAKTTLSNRMSTLIAEIKKLSNQRENIDSDIKKYTGLIDNADKRMSNASISMAYHKKHMMME